MEDLKIQELIKAYLKDHLKVEISTDIDRTSSSSVEVKLILDDEVISVSDASL